MELAGLEVPLPVAQARDALGVDEARLALAQRLFRLLALGDFLFKCGNSSHPEGIEQPTEN